MSATGTLSPREIEAAIERLSPSQLAELARWFRDHFENEWDRHIEADAVSGRLSHMAREAAAEYAAGNTIEFPPSEQPGD